MEKSGSNKDGCTRYGDHADFWPVLKPYHGVRMYRNEGDYAFTEAYRYPVYGATRILNADGDIDMTASAYFPDFNGIRPRVGEEDRAVARREREYGGAEDE